MAILLIRNGRVLDPAQGLDRVRDLWLEDGCVQPDGFSAPKADELIEATGMLVMPGFVDAHVHLREPGNEAAETIESGCAAALAGGYTHIVCMPNTTPAIDRPEVVRQVIDKAEKLNGPYVHAMPAITLGRAGKTLSDLSALNIHPVTGFTDDGNGLEDEELARQAMAFCARETLTFAEHCEYRRVSAGGVMHAGPAAARLGLKGYPPEAETAMVERDIRLCEETGAHVHFQHLSAASSVQLVREAKRRGVKVTAEVTPHHLTLTDEDAARGGPNFKMNPPLRSEADRQALVEALREGVIDMIATDHAPHTPESKAKSFAGAPFGVIGMETAAAVIWTRLVMTGLLSPLQMADRMSVAPMKAFRLANPGLPAVGGAFGDQGWLKPHFRCNAVLFDPNARWTVNPEEFRSRSRNCPFAGWELNGRVVATIVDGQVKHRDNLR